MLAVGALLGGAAMAVLGSLAPAGCAEDAPKPSAEEPVVIGVSLGLTKDLSSFTGPLRDAVRAAEGEINAAGGVLGRQVRFDIVDDESDEGDLVVGVANRFATARVAAMLGPVGSGQVKATQQIFAERQIIQISPSATSVELTDIQPEGERFLFRTTPADDFQGAAVILLAQQSPRGLPDAGAGGGDAGVTSCKNLALVYLDNPYGTSMAKVITDNFPKTGGTVGIQQKLALRAQGSYADIVPGIVATNPDCLALICYERAAAQFVRDFKSDPGYAALAAKGFFFIGTDGVFTQGFLDLSRSNPSDDTSASFAEGVFGTNPDTQPGTTEYNAYRTIYASYFPLRAADEAPAFTANTFDAAVLAAFAIQKAGSTTDRAAIRDALRDVSSPPGTTVTPANIGAALAELRAGGDVDYKGASGNVNFQANGNVNAGFIVWNAVKDLSGRVVYRTAARFTTEQLQAAIQ